MKIVERYSISTFAEFVIGPTLLFKGSTSPIYAIVPITLNSEIFFKSMHCYNVHVGTSEERAEYKMKKWE